MHVPDMYTGTYFEGAGAPAPDENSTGMARRDAFPEIYRRSSPGILHGGKGKRARSMSRDKKKGEREEREKETERGEGRYAEPTLRRGNIFFNFSLARVEINQKLIAPNGRNRTDRDIHIKSAPRIRNKCNGSLTSLDIADRTLKNLRR